MTIEVTRLDNGLTVVSQTMPHLESAALGVWVGAGSRKERIEENGIAHFLEHMAFKGTKTRSAQRIVEEIEQVGGDLNAATDVETTAYHARVLKDDVPLALDILADILRNSVFDREEIARERHVVLQEIGAASDTPDDIVFDLLSEAAFADQPLGRPILGTEATVSSFDEAAIRGFLDAHYRAPRMVVSAAGAVSHDALLEQARGLFGDLPGAAATQPVPAAYRGGERREERDLMEAQIVLGFPGRSYHAADFYVVQVLSSVLGGGMSSRLFQEIREKRGLCYSIYSHHSSYSDAGLFMVHTATAGEDVPEMIEALVAELARAGADIGDAEVARAKAQMRAGLMMGLESPVACAGRNARQQLVFGRAIPVAETVARIDAVTAADLRAMAAELFGAKAPTLAAVGPLGDLAPLSGIADMLAAAGA
ncbi:MAG TPA: pitrilysin family protein [Hyphomicrobiales bacterium]|nr:pitrilysin family protein [Kaistiaceae bacterium]HQF30918.1 pitrilysin family protein [Hyphomicrobiales bacterium]